MFDWSSLARIDIDDRVRAVVDAIKVAQRYAPAAILEATGVEFGAILDGLLPGLLMCLCLVVATTALGTAAGAAIGALALGIGAAPGAAFGASAGFEAGVALLEGLGLAFLVTVIGTSVGEAGRLARRAVHEAWHSVDEPSSRRLHVDHAGRTLASAAAALMRGVLQGIVAFLVAKGANAAASRVPELMTRLRASKLGEGFAAWVERNWRSLITNDRLKQSREPKAVGDGGGGARTSQTGSASGISKSPAAPSTGSRGPSRPKDPSGSKTEPKQAAAVPSEPVLDPEYVNAVAKFKGQNPEEVTAFYENEMGKGIDHRPLIDSAVENHPGLTRAEAETIYGYTGKQWYRDFNADLEAGGSPQREDLSRLLKSGLDEMPDSSSPTQYRGLRIDDPEQLRAFDSEYAPGNTVEVKSFWSTAPDSGNAYAGSRNLVINTDSAKDISDLSFGSHFHQAVGKDAVQRGNDHPAGHAAAGG